jgi:hypothetical protein
MKAHRESSVGVPVVAVLVISVVLSLLAGRFSSRGLLGWFGQNRWDVLVVRCALIGLVTWALVTIFRTVRRKRS